MHASVTKPCNDEDTNEGNRESVHNNSKNVSLYSVCTS